MTIDKERKQSVVKTYGKSDTDTGRTEVQVALLTERIKDLTSHFKSHPTDFHSRRGLLKLVGQRKRLLEYLKMNDIEKYRSLIKELGIRR